MWPANIHSIGKDILRFHADLLAGHADGRRRRAADAGVGARLPHGRRQEDVEDERSPASTRSSCSIISASTPTATTSCGEIQFGAGRRLLVGGHGRAPQRRPRERARQPRQPGPRDARDQLRRGGSRPCGGGRGGRPARGHRRRRASGSTSTCCAVEPPAGRSRRCGRSSTARTATSSRRSRGSSRRTPRAATSSRASCTRAPRRCGSWRC